MDGRSLKETNRVQGSQTDIWPLTLWPGRMMPQKKDRWSNLLSWRKLWIGNRLLLSGGGKKVEKVPPIR
jgi:hypothetical protein